MICARSSSAASAGVGAISCGIIFFNDEHADTSVLVLGWSYTKKRWSDGREGGKVEKGSVAMISMLLKIIYIQWVKVATDGARFDESKVWRIFWGRA